MTAQNNPWAVKVYLATASSVDSFVRAHENVQKCSAVQCCTAASIFLEAGRLPTSYIGEQGLVQKLSKKLKILF